MVADESVSVAQQLQSALPGRILFVGVDGDTWDEGCPSGGDVREDDVSAFAFSVWASTAAAVEVSAAVWSGFELDDGGWYVGAVGCA